MYASLQTEDAPKAAQDVSTCCWVSISMCPNAFEQATSDDATPPAQGDATPPAHDEPQGSTDVSKHVSISLYHS